MTTTGRDLNTDRLPAIATSELPHQDKSQPSPEPRIPRLYTIREVATRLRVHPSTFVRVICEGRIACVRVRRRIIISEPQLATYIHQQGAFTCKHESRAHSSTAITGWSADRTPRATTFTGANRAHAASAAQARAQAI